MMVKFPVQGTWSVFCESILRQANLSHNQNLVKGMVYPNKTDKESNGDPRIFMAAQVNWPTCVPVCYELAKLQIRFLPVPDICFRPS